MNRRNLMKNQKLHVTREYKDIRELLEWSADTFGERNAFSYASPKNKKETETVTFASFRDDVRALTTELRSMGVTDKHCAVVGKMSYEFALLYYSILSAGGVIVPLDRDWSAKELAKTAARADASFLFIDEDIKDKAETIEAEAKLLSSAFVLRGRRNGSDLDKLIDAGAEKFAKDSSPYFDSPIDPQRMALIVFTSGTTGEGKGVMLNQTAVIKDMSNIIAYIDFADKTVSVLPPHHTYGSTVMLIGHVMIGCEMYISSGLRYIQRELKEQKPGHLVLVPLYLETFYRKIWATIKEKGKEKLVTRMIKISNALRKIGIDLRKLLFKDIVAAFGGKAKMVISGGAPINSEILHFFESVGVATLNGYGITECAPLIAVNRSKNVVPGSVGNVLDMDTVVIDSPNEDGEGEIWVSGPNVMLGYYKNEEATAAALTPDGFFKTGDYGKVDENGILYITGRKKNLIILSNGKNVYPEEIESDLLATPGLLDIIVYEGQSRRGMEHNAIVAEVYTDKDYMEKNGITDVKKYIQGYVDEYNKTAVPYKKIAVLKVRDEEFPKNTLRKIQRFKLDMSID